MLRNCCLFLILICATQMSFAGRLSGYIEGLYNTIGSQTFPDSETGQEKVVEGNQFWFDAALKYQHKGKKNHIRLDSQFRYTDLGVLQFSVKEASVSRRYKNFDLSYGRVYVNWSHLDRDWAIGKVNNRVNFDFYNSDQEGLVGLLLKSKRRKGFFWQFFASPVYVPELNPGQNIDEDARTITPNSAWATEVSQSINLDSGSINIFYDVEVPPIPEIVFQYSVGAQVGYQSSLVKWDGFILRKPENNLTLGANISLDSSQGNIIVASVEPKVFYHTVLGGNLRYKLGKRLFLKGSALASIPEKVPETPFSRSFYETTNIKTGKRDENYLSASLVKQSSNYRLALKYIARISEFDRTDDVLAPNPRWNQAIGAFAQWRFATKFRATVDARFDMLTLDRVISADLSFKASRNILLRAGVQVIGIDENEQSFWTPFANNDNVYVAGRFLF